MSMKALRNVRNSIVSSLRRCSSWRGAQRGVTGSSRAHSLEAPGEGRHHHVGPVGLEGVDRRVQGAHPALQLGD